MLIVFLIDFTDIKNAYTCRYCFDAHVSLIRRNGHENFRCVYKSRPIKSFNFKGGETEKEYYERLVKYFCDSCRWIFPSEEKKRMHLEKVHYGKLKADFN